MSKVVAMNEWVVVAVLVIGFRLLTAVIGHPGPTGSPLIADHRKRTRGRWLPMLHRLQLVLGALAVFDLWESLGPFGALLGASLWWLLASWSHLATWVAVPWRLPRAAHCLVRGSLHYWARDRRAGAAIMALRAVGDRQVPGWLDRDIAELPRTGAGALARALLAERGGRRDEAEALALTALSYDRRLLPPEARKMAILWVATEYAAEGEWAELQLLGEQGCLPYEKLLPKSETASRILRRAEGYRPPEVETREETPKTELPTLLAGLQRLEARPGRHAEATQLARGFRGLLTSPALLARVRERLETLRSEAPPDAVLDRFEEEVWERLAAHAPAGTLEVGAGVRNERLEAAFRELEYCAAALESPSRDEAALWESWLAALRAYQAVIHRGILADRREAFSVLWSPGCRFASHLWADGRGQVGLANSVDRRLFWEAKIVGDSDAIHVCRQNLAAARASA